MRLLLLAELACLSQAAYFLHFTDFHHDPYYAPIGGVPPSQGGLCRRQPGKPGTRLGQYGTYGCDSPWSLVAKSLAEAKSLAPSPAFIAYSGDTMPHIDNSRLNATMVLEELANLTDAMKALWPGVPIYPAIGNHDYWPADDTPPHNNTIYAGMAAIWRPFIGDQPTMFEGGYYAVKVPKLPLTLLSLNTVLIYGGDTLNQSVLGDDPAHMLSWLADQLYQVRQEGRKALLLSHVSPGYIGEGKWAHALLKKAYSKAFLSVLEINADVLLPLVQGHVHADRIVLLRNDWGHVIGSILLGPSVVPWPGNPAFRTIHFDTAPSFHFTDVLTYFLNLTKANSASGAHFELEYSMKAAYNLSTIDNVNLANLVERIQHNDSLFTAYYRRIFRGYITEPCDSAACKAAELCSMWDAWLDAHAACMAAIPGAAGAPALLPALFLAPLALLA